MKGGYRLGAGRKKGFAARSSEEARRIFSEMLMQEIRPIARALIVKAKSGDVAAAREILDRSWGKAAQATEISDSPRPQEDLMEEYYREMGIQKDTVGTA